MPTYGYRCEKNGHEFEVVQTFADPPLTRCKICGSKVNRLFYPVGIVFKGPGFYATDNRGSQPVATSGEQGEKGDKGDKREKSESDGKADNAEVKAAKTESKTKGKTDSKPKSGTSSKKS